MREASVNRAVIGLIRLLLRAIWFVFVPLVSTGIALRFCVPYAVSAPGLEGELARFAREHTLIVALSTFLVLAALLHYVRAFIPGGSYLAALPVSLVGRVPRRRVVACERASRVLSWLETKLGRRWLESAALDLRSAVLRERDQLAELLAAGKWSRISRASESLERMTRGARSTSGIGTHALFVLGVAAAALLALQLRGRYVQSYEVFGWSMLPTLNPGELLLGNVAAYRNGRLPERGDLVVIRATVDGAERELVKRVIGLPGDHLEMRGGVPVINGWVAPICDAGPYYSPDDEAARVGNVGGRVYVEFLEREAYFTFQTMLIAPFPDYVVKPGEIFVLGDNRSSSRDSRNFDHGGAHGFPLASVEAKVTRLLFSRTRRGELDASSVWQPLTRTPSLEGVDMSEVDAGVRRCLALRPELTSPPSAASTALARAPQ